MEWLVGGLVAAGLFVIVIYNRLVALRQRLKNSFADIDVQLKQRYDLVPNLVETVKGYAAHEKGVFEKVTEARSSAMRATSTVDRAQAESALSSALMNLYAVAENYPDLKANQNFSGLQSELSDIEDKIAAARRFYNNSVNEYNTAIQQFPAVLVAGPFGFREESFFELDAGEKEEARKAPKVGFGN